MSDALKALKTYYNRPSEKVISFSNSDYCNQIILIRHGQPDLPKIIWAQRKDAQRYALDYDKVGVLPLDAMRLSLENINIKHVFSSPTPRALHTARLLVGERIQIITDSRFREFERKIFWFPGINVFLPLRFWFTFSRILWLLGFNSKGIESRVKAYIRAQENATFLINEAKQFGNALLVAHGFHNKVVIDALKKQNWSVVLKGGKGYGAINILAKEADR